MTRILEKYAQYLVLAPLPDESLTQAQGPSMQSVKLPSRYAGTGAI